jgi:hypothetical protein
MNVHLVILLSIIFQERLFHRFLNRCDLSHKENTRAKILFIFITLHHKKPMRITAVLFSPLSLRETLLSGGNMSNSDQHVVSDDIRNNPSTRLDRYHNFELLLIYKGL